MKILVTGGAGFLGSHLCEKLLIDNEVLCIDNFYTGQKKNIKHLLKNKNFLQINHDIINSFDADVDQIYNLASPASPEKYQKDPIYTTKTNIYGSVNMLNLAKSRKIRIMQASTSEVYGDPLIHPQKENYFGNVNPVGIRACYDEGKRCAESLFFDYFRKFNVDIKVVRIFNTYGPRMSINDGRVVSNFIVQAIKGENITIYGDGSQTRSFCYVDDLINFFIKFMNSNKQLTGPINAGNSSEYSMLHLAELVLKLIGGKSKLKFLPLPLDDPKQRKPDLSFAKSSLNWEPKVCLEDGLKETINYFKKIY